MTNLEKFEEQIKLYVYSDTHWCVKDGKLMGYTDYMTCENCKFNSNDTCANEKLKWLQEEYKEPTLDWNKVEVDTPILVSADNENWYKRYFAKYVNGEVYAYDCGATSWSQMGCGNWNYAKLPEVENET